MMPRAPERVHRRAIFLDFRREDADLQLEYKYVETSYVTDDELSRLVNLWTGQGWRYESVQFAMREASKRPAMAFLLFTRPADGGGSGGG